MLRAATYFLATFTIFLPLFMWALQKYIGDSGLTLAVMFTVIISWIILFVVSENESAKTIQKLLDKQGPINIGGDSSA